MSSSYGVPNGGRRVRVLRGSSRRVRPMNADTSAATRSRVWLRGSCCDSAQKKRIGRVLKRS